MSNSVAPSSSLVTKTGALLCVAALTFGVSDGFVVPEQLTFPSIRHSTSAGPSETVLFAENGLLLMKQGLKWVLVPNSKDLAEVSAPAGGMSPAAERLAAISDVSSRPVVTATATPPPPPPPVLVAEKVVNTVATTPPPVASIPPPPPPPMPEVVIPEPVVSVPVVEILPKTDVAAATSAAAPKSVDFHELLEAIRENHWSKLSVAETPSHDKLASSQKASSLWDMMQTGGSQAREAMKHSSGAAAEGYASKLGPEIAHLKSIIAETSKHMQEQVRETAYANADAMRAYAQDHSLVMPESFKERVSVMVDPAIFSALKEKIANSASNSISLEEMKAMFHLDNIETLNVKDLFNLPQVSLVAASWSEFTASLSAVKSTLEQARSGGSFDADDVVNAMNLKQTGGWYFGAASFVVLLALSASAKSGDNKSQKILLTDAATPAAKAPTPSTSSLSSELDEQVAKLKDATSAVYDQLNEMQVEKNARAHEVATMKSELRIVMNRLDANMAEENRLRVSLEATQEQLEQETTYLRKQLHERVAAEEELRDQLAATKDKLAQEMMKAEMSKQQAETDVQAAEAQVSQLQQEKAQMEQEMAALRNEMFALQKQLGKEQKDVVVPPVVTDRPRINGGATTLPNAKSYMDLSNAFFAAISDPVNPVSNPPPNVPGAKGAAANLNGGKTRVVRKVMVKKKVARVGGGGGASGAALDTSAAAPTLNRKAEKATRATVGTGTDGKALRKDALM